MNKPRIIIIGGGFGGVKCGQTLSRKPPPDKAQVVLFDRQNHSQVYELLKNTRIHSLLEPVPQPLLNPDNTLREVSQAFIEQGNEFFCVSANGQTLDGVVTITDLVRGGSVQGESARLG
jgi:hypothetical protein